MRKSRETSDETSFESVEKPIDKYFVKSVSTNIIMIWVRMKKFVVIFVKK